MKIKKFILVLFVTIWAILLGIGFVWMADYTSRPGLPAKFNAKIPAEYFQKSTENLPQLFLFLHPKCSCSLATLSELEHLVADNQNRLEITVFFYKPVEESDDWVKTNLWYRTRRISPVKIVILTGDEIEKFGVITSGQTLLYDGDENLIFSGGITVARGHEGKSIGREAIENYLQARNISVRETPVFGCLLTSS